MKVLVTARMPEEVLSLFGQEHQVESYGADPPIDRQRLIQSIADKEGSLHDYRPHRYRGPRSPSVLKVIANYGVGFQST